MEVIYAKQFLLFTVFNSKKTEGEKTTLGCTHRRTRKNKYYMQPTASFWNLLPPEIINSRTVSRFFKAG